MLYPAPTNYRIYANIYILLTLPKVALAIEQTKTHGINLEKSIQSYQVYWCYDWEDLA